MDRDPPPPRTTSTIPFAAGDSTPAGSPMVRGPTSYPMLTLSSSSSAHSHRRRYSPSLYPPPLPGRHASSGYGSSRFQLRQQIPPPTPTPRVEVERPTGRPRTTTRPLPTPFLSELAEIRRVGATLFGDLDAPAAIRRVAARPALHGGRYQQAWTSSSSTTMSARGRSLSSGFAPPPPSAAGMPPPPLPSHRFSAGYSPTASSSQRRQHQPSFSGAPPPPAGIFSGPPSWARSSAGLAPPVSRRQLLPPSTGMQPLPTPRFSGPGRILSESSRPWASQQQQPAPQPPLSTRLAPLPGGCGMVLSEPPPPASQQQQAQPLPTGSGILSGFPSPAASQQEQAHPCWSTDLASALSSVSGGSGIFTTGSAPPATSPQQLPAKASSFTDLAPLPGGCGFSGLTTPSHTNETTMFGSSSWSPADTATAAAIASDTMYYGHAQPSSSDSSELPPLPPCLQMQPEYQNQAPSFWQQPSRNNNSSYGTETATTAYTATESEETRLQLPTHLLQVVKEEPVVDEAPPCLEPVFIALDDDGNNDGLLLSALLDSFQSSGEPASSLPNHAPLSSQGWLQPGGGCGGRGVGELGDVEGSGQSWDLEAMLQTPGSSGASGSIPMNSQGSMSISQQQIPPQQAGDLFSTGFSDWQLSQNDLQIPMLPSSTDSLQLNSSHSPSIWGPSCADGSGQGSAVMPAALANMFHHMSIIGQGGLTAPAAAGGQYDMLGFDNYSCNSSSDWAAMPSFASNFDQMMGTGGGNMSIGQGIPATPAPMFDISGGSSSSACASMQLNFSSSTIESSTPEPKLRLGGMERTRMPRWTPSLPAGASSGGMLRRGAYGDFFSEADMVMINKDKRLKEMVNTDPKRVKRILNNRASVVKLRAQRHVEF